MGVRSAVLWLALIACAGARVGVTARIDRSAWLSGGDVELAGERIRIGPDARIAGKVEYRSGRPIVIDPDATIMGTTFSFGLVLIGVLMLFGYLIAAIFVGDTVLERLNPAKAQSVGWIPFLGGVVVALLFVAGIGALTLRAWQGFRRDTEQAPATA